ncbi:ankyrin repeat-containing domain protein [Russula ochroleuca]|uniref:Ankyrin repeat-containing domain protein n=1 Tax=Russula ochroleuca TaxID=152965 RepID=A0A9P5N787_9AGAM|nr:ankyrin repeat-containing domain protein [Russula ochroleuca]
MNARDIYSSTPLHVAVRRGCVKVVRMLLEHGANTGAIDIWGRTPFWVAWSSDVIELLSEHGAK